MTYPDKQMEFSDGIFLNAHEMILACEYGVLLFNTKTKVFSKIPVYDENNREVFITRVENTGMDRAGNYMLTSKTGIFFYDPVSRSCKRKTDTSPDLSAFNEYEVFNVIQDRYGFYWLATNKKGLLRFDPSLRKMHALPLPTPLQNESLRFDVVMQDSQNTIWAGSSHGLFKIDPESLALEYFSADKSQPVSLSHSEINVITEDRDHAMWIGTVGGGINKIIPQVSGFKNVRLVKENPGNTTGSYFMGLQQVGNDIWFINIWDQVGYVNLLTGTISVFSKPQLPAAYSWYSEGTIMKNKENHPVMLNGENMFEVTKTGSGYIAIRTEPAQGLQLIYNRKNNHSCFMVKADVPQTFFRNDTLYSNQFFYDAVEDAAGDLWVGGSKGLTKLAQENNTILQYRHDDQNSSSISSDYIYALETDRDNQTIWMAAYHGGLCSFNTATGNFRHYGKEDGLQDNIVNALEKDDHGNLWFSTNTGISSYDVRQQLFRNYGNADGLLNIEYNRRASFKNNEGWIFFGGIHGIDYFHPDSVRIHNRIPSLAFTNFRIANRDYIPQKTGSIPVIELRHSDHYFSVEFAALDFNDPQKIQYAYRFDDIGEWIHTGTQHSLSFTDQAPGAYKLQIRSTSVAGIWADNEIMCRIVVHPSWWQTILFRSLAIGFLIVLALLLIRGYYRRKLEKQKIILEKKQAIEKERTRIATDMHDDLGAGLSRIKFLSETIGLKKQHQQPIDEDIRGISHYSHEMIDKMGEIVWALNEKNDTLSDLVAYTRAYAVDYLSQNGVRCIAETPENLHDSFVSGEFRRNIYLTVKEALHNVVKHADASTVYFTVQQEQSLSFQIQDDGSGFDKNKIRPFSSGLINMEQRIKEIGGEFRIWQSAGTLIKFTVPLPG